MCSCIQYLWQVEFFFASLKLITLVGLIIFGVIVNCGGVNNEYIGGRYWVHEPFNDNFLDLKPLSKARFLGFWSCLTSAAFSYSGIESLAVVSCVLNSIVPGVSRI